MKAILRLLAWAALSATALYLAVRPDQGAVFAGRPDSAIAAGPVSHPSGGAARGYFWSILLMLCVPFGTAAGLGTMLVWQVRRQRRANEQAHHEEHEGHEERRLRRIAPAAGAPGASFESKDEDENLAYQ